MTFPRRAPRTRPSNCSPARPGTKPEEIARRRFAPRIVRVIARKRSGETSCIQNAGLREETKKQIERDNHARKHDENWTTTEGVSKGGKDINTFRGKYGEEQGG